ncbi:MAG: PIN domain-containing protein [Thermoguttaceae bacterium]
MQRKLKLFLDTSIISHIVAPHKPYEEAATKAFFRYLADYPDEYELLISPAVRAEVEACPVQIKRKMMTDLLTTFQIAVLPESDEAVQLAQIYLQQGVLSKRSLDDLTHIAYAVVNHCDYILSWNFKHFVNVTTINAVNSINVAMSYRMTSIVTPQFFTGESPNAEI